MQINLYSIFAEILIEKMDPKGRALLLTQKKDPNT